MNRRWRNLTLDRRRRSDPPFSVPAGQPPVSFIPQWIEPQGARPRYAPLLRRGKFTSVPLVGLAPPAPTFVPRYKSKRPWQGPTRRGNFYEIPLAGLAPALAPFIPRYNRRRTQLGFVRSGSFYQIPTLPGRIFPHTRKRVQTPALPRRGERWIAPFTSPPPAGPGPLVARHTTPAMRWSLPSRAGVFVPPPVPTPAPAVVTYRLRDLYIEVPFLAEGGALAYKQRIGVTAYGNAAPLNTTTDPSRIVLEGVSYVFRGGYVHDTTDPAIRDLWLASGFEVDEIV